MSKEKIYVTKSYLPPMEEYISYLERIWDSHKLTNFSELHEEFRARLTKMCDTRFCFPTVNGHTALELGIQGLDLQGEVITTPFTFASTTHAIVRNGLTPVFCDIRESDCTIDVSKIESLITDKTVAIAAVHVYGMPCDVYEIEKIAKKHKLKVIYDGAHAFGEKLNGKSMMSFGDFTMMSFHATKSFHTIEGGAIAFNSLGLAQRFYQLGNFGITDEDKVEFVGSNAKMNEFQAAMGLCNLDHYEEVRMQRKAVYDRYYEQLKDVDSITIPRPQFEDFVFNYTYFPIIIDEKKAGVNRDKLRKILMKHDVYPRKYFYPLTCDFDCYKDLGYTADVPIARRISSSVLTLPCYDSLSLEDVDNIVSIIKPHL